MIRARIRDARNKRQRDQNRAVVITVSANGYCASTPDCGRPEIPLASDGVSERWAADMDGDTEVETRSSTQEPTICSGDDEAEPSPTSQPHLCLMDLSGYLGCGTAGGEEDGGSLTTTLDGEACTRMAVDADPYGWELDGKSSLSLPVCAQSNLDTTGGNLHYRRANGGRRSLVHRVLSLGVVPRLTERNI